MCINLVSLFLLVFVKLYFINVNFQIALVTWAESMNLALVKRDLNSITLRTPIGTLSSFTILQIFPFTSESKRMGIILKV